jgi:hypothetical protein
MLSTRPRRANQVSVQPPQSQIRMGATLLITRWGAGGGPAIATQGTNFPVSAPRLLSY